MAIATYSVKAKPLAAKSQAAKAQAAKAKSPRAIASLVLAKLLKQQGSLASLLPEASQGLNPQQQALVKELCYGCCRWFPLLDEVLKQLVQKPLKAKDSDIKALLIIGLYQLEFMGLADHAAVNETVGSTKALKKAWAKNLVNGVLRQYQRNRDSLIAKAKQAQPYAHPQWLLDRIQEAWPEQAETIFSANNQHPPMTLRVNRRKSTREAYLQKLTDQGIAAAPGQYSGEAVYLAQAVSVSQLPGFTEGWVSVQDEAAQLASGLLDLAPGLKVLDACAAPGGKTGHIGETAPELGKLVALDVEQRRLQRVQENLDRLQVSADIVCGDASQPDTWWDGERFDRILLDAPCSATGIIRRQSDIKLLRQPEHIASLQQTQLALLKALWPLLAEGGKLVYATCSILPEENEQVVEQFLAVQDDAQNILFDVNWGVAQTYGRQLFPADQGHDGFYYACLKKSKAE